MNISLNNPTDVYEHVGKTFGCTATFSDIVKSCEDELSGLYNKIETKLNENNHRQREIVIFLESLQRFEDSEELNRQRKNAQADLDECKRKQDIIKKLFEDYRNLVMEYKSLSDDVEALAENVKKPVQSVKKLLTKYMNCLW